MRQYVKTNSQHIRRQVWSDKNKKHILMSNYTYMSIVCEWFYAIDLL